MLSDGPLLMMIYAACRVSVYWFFTRAVLAVALCLSVGLSVSQIGVLSKRINEFNRFFWYEALSYIVF